MRAFRFAGFVLCMAGLLTLIGLCPRAFAIGDSEYSRPTLRGLNSVFVLVEEVDPEIERDGLTASQIKTDVELKLRLAGIKVFSRAEAVKQKLKETGFSQITTILNKEATQRRILTELFNELPQKVGRNDRVLFYFAGHGQTDDLPGGEKKGYIIPVDGDISNYSATSISMEQIRSLSNRIPAKHILYVMDSCYSGLGLNRSSGVSPKIGDYLRKVSSMRVVQIITAGGKGEQVQEKEGHGLFTTYLLKAIEGEADFNKDNVVTGTELGAYLRPTVSNASSQAQTPLYGRLEGEGEFLLFVTKR